MMIIINVHTTKLNICGSQGEQQNEFKVKTRTKVKQEIFEIKYNELK